MTVVAVVGSGFSRIAARSSRMVRETAGATLVEAAIITPLLLILSFSIADMGGLFYVYLALENGVSQATRYAVTGNQMADPESPGSTLPRAESIKAAMREATPLTLPDSGFAFSHRSPGGASWLGGVGGPNDVEKVTVTYTWSILTPVLRPFFENGELALTVESAMKNEGRFE